MTVEDAGAACRQPKGLPTGPLSSYAYHRLIAWSRTTHDRQHARKLALPSWRAAPTPCGEVFVARVEDPSKLTAEQDEIGRQTTETLVG